MYTLSLVRLSLTQLALTWLDIDFTQEVAESTFVQVALPAESLWSSYMNEVDRGLVDGARACAMMAMLFTVSPVLVADILLLLGHTTLPLGSTSLPLKPLALALWAATWLLTMLSFALFAAVGVCLDSYPFCGYSYGPGFAFMVLIWLICFPAVFLAYRAWKDDNNSNSNGNSSAKAYSAGAAPPSGPSNAPPAAATFNARLPTGPKPGTIGGPPAGPRPGAVGGPPPGPNPNNPPLR